MCLGFVCGGRECELLKASQNEGWACSPQGETRAVGVCWLLVVGRQAVQYHQLVVKEHVFVTRVTIYWFVFGAGVRFQQGLGCDLRGELQLHVRHMCVFVCVCLGWGWGPKPRGVLHLLRIQAREPDQNLLELQSWMVVTTRCGCSCSCGPEHWGPAGMSTLDLGSCLRSFMGGLPTDGQYDCDCGWGTDA